jgi:hypothetical protein
VSEYFEHGQQEPSDHLSDDVVDDGRTAGSLPQETPVELTGHAAVDEVLRSMQGLQQRPVEEHVAVFEAAHEKLRAALANAGDRPHGPTGS